MLLRSRDLSGRGAFAERVDGRDLPSARVHWTHFCRHPDPAPSAAGNLRGDEEAGHRQGRYYLRVACVVSAGSSGLNPAWSSRYSTSFMPSWFAVVTITVCVTWSASKLSIP